VSGFACVIGPEGGEATVRRMLETAPHRGPVRSTWSEGGVALGVQGRSGEHPFVSGGCYVDDDVVAVGTGALYRGASVVTGDAAIRGVAQAHRAGRLETLAGSYAAVVVERRTGRAVAVRSPVGERPLFWRREGGSVAFASEVKQLAVWSWPPRVDEEAVLDLVAQRFERPERTTYVGIRRLLPGTTLEVAGEATERRFWRPGDGAGTRSVPFEEAVREFRRLLYQAVARRLGPGIAVLMSGGLDSTSVAAEAAPLHRSYGSLLCVVSAAYPDHPAVDESAAAQATAEVLGSEVTWVLPRPRPFEDLNRRVWLHDGPDPAPLSSNLEQILTAVCLQGIPAVLDGHDGDTVLGVAPGLIRALLRRGRLGTTAGRVAFMRRRLGVGAGHAIRRVLIPGVVDVIPGARSAWRRLRSPPDPWPPWVGEALRRPYDGRVRDWALDQVEAVMGPLMLGIEHLERTAASCEVDLLHPYCDPDLVDYLLGLPPEVKFAGGVTKALVREGYPELPPQVRHRIDKVMFNDVGTAGSTREEIAAQVSAVGRRLPGIDWPALERRIQQEDLPFWERSLIARVLSAELFLEAA
jgi:asparagine synthetase B (glutamine-hydrolysing)